MRRVSHISARGRTLQEREGADWSSESEVLGAEMKQAGEGRRSQDWRRNKDFIFCLSVFAFAVLSAWNALPHPQIPASFTLHLLQICSNVIFFMRALLTILFIIGTTCLPHPSNTSAVLFFPHTLFTTSWHPMYFTYSFAHCLFPCTRI